MIRLKQYLEDSSGKTLTDRQLEQFERYYEMLIEKNKVMNLTAITERNEVIVKHFMDSVALAGSFDLDRDLHVIDVGTGAGFPGIPLKIAFPRLNMTLFDSLNKRVKFLDEVIEGLNLNEEGNCVAMHGRAEEGGRNAALREAYDLVVSRAVANMAVLSEYALPFVKRDGYFISYKTETIDDELKAAKRAISILGGKVENVVKMKLSDTDIGRSFVMIRKVKPTPKAYPRKAGTASKQPL